MQVTAGIAGHLIMVSEPGTVVHTGEAVARIDKQPLLLQRAEQEASLERAQINIRQLESQLRCQRDLQGSNLVLEFELERTQANRDLAISDANITRVHIRQIEDQIRRADVSRPVGSVPKHATNRTGVRRVGSLNLRPISGGRIHLARTGAVDLDDIGVGTPVEINQAGTNVHL